MIDLHTHTSESDGRCTPRELVARAAAAGITVLAVTDHDTVSGCAPTSTACATAGIAFVPGIEITSVRDDADVHMLGYFVDLASQDLQAFLAEQRRLRIERLREMVARLTALGLELDADAILRPALEDSRKSAGRPWIARALVAGGHASSSNEAFERWLVPGRPTFVPPRGASPSEVIARIHAANGIASLAHPGLVGHDEWIAGLVNDGLDAIEAYHSEHDAAASSRYVRMAAALGIAVSGGSDYHGDQARGSRHLGGVGLPPADYDRLLQARR